MDETSKPKRAYNSTRRRAQAGQTRQQIAEAALKLFTEHGYAGATIEAIADEAGVAPETIYATFGNKRTVLHHLLDVSVVGDDAPIPLLERPELQAMMREPDQRKQLAMLSYGCAAIMERVTPVFEVMRMAAKTEPEIAVLLEHFLEERRQNMRNLIRHVEANGPLREGVDGEQAADLLWSLSSAEMLSLLRVDRGWSAERYAEWLVDSLIRLILP